VRLVGSWLWERLRRKEGGKNEEVKQRRKRNEKGVQVKGREDGVGWVR
jgi:hypothetical protein